MSSFWTSCLSQFEQELPPQQFNTWIRPLRLEGEDNFAKGLRLLAPNGFILKWVKERYLSRIEELGSAYFSAPVSVSLMLGERTAAPLNPPQPRVVGTAPIERRLNSQSPASPVLEHKQAKARSLYEKTRLIPGFTFENLMITTENATLDPAWFEGLTVKNVTVNGTELDD